MARTLPATLDEHRARLRRQARVLICDFITGRLAGGHQADYLAALEDALCDLEPVTIAPFRTRKPGGSRAGLYAETFGALRRALSGKPGALLAFPTPDFRDFLMFFLAALCSRRGVAIFVMRRDALATAITPTRARLLVGMVRYLAGRRRAFMVFDSKPARTYWEELAGRSGALVTIPPRAGPATAAPARSSAEGPVVSLLGAFRLEKGARVYGMAIAAALSLSPSVRVQCQLGDLDEASEEGRLARDLKRDWGADPRVRLLEGHLTSDDFTTAMAQTDILLLPYDVASYGVGTSGVLHEAREVGAVVLVTEITWAVAEYADDEGVHWLKGVTQAELAAGLQAATARAAAGRSPQNRAGPEAFASTWTLALAEALEWGGPR